MFNNSYSEFIYKRTYARYIEDQGRREDWPESVERYCNFMIERVPEEMHPEYLEAIGGLGMHMVTPAMRSFWTAGPALGRENVCGYGCAYTTIEKPKDFAELLYILMCGTGVTPSVERQYINNLPTVPSELNPTDKVIVFRDSKLGWAEGYYKYLNNLYTGDIVECDLSKIRPKGERLKTFGGRASGPEPLKRLIDFTKRIFINARGRKLNSLECFDICCYIASIVVVGGVRRAALMSLSNLSDDRMRHAKDGNFFETNPQRGMSNNSVAYTEKPDCTTFMKEWLSLARSGTGERGIFNREGSKHIAGRNGRRDPDVEFGCNPCSEIILRPKQFCNLSEVIVRPDDTLSTLKTKVRYATILGIVQSTLTDFRFLSAEWKKNCEEERLLGVSLSGERDHKILGSVNDRAKRWLTALKAEAIGTAKRWSKVLGINMPAAITCVKPSGTVSQLVNCASGMHARYAPYYIRRVRVAAVDPIAKYMIDAGVPWNPDPYEKDPLNPSTVVFDFPIKSPEEAVCNADSDAIEQLEYWRMYQEYWCEHKPSCTVYVKADEWLKVGNWVYENWDLVSGISFYPVDGSVYLLPPYEEIDELTYCRLEKAFPELDFSKLDQYEQEDQTQGATEFACAGGACEIV